MEMLSHRQLSKKKGWPESDQVWSLLSQAEQSDAMEKGSGLGVKDWVQDSA